MVSPRREPSPWRSWIPSAHFVLSSFRDRPESVVRKRFAVGRLGRQLRFFVIFGMFRAAVMTPTTPHVSRLAVVGGRLGADATEILQLQFQGGRLRNRQELGALGDIMAV